MSMSQFNKWAKDNGIVKGPRCYVVECEAGDLVGEYGFGAILRLTLRLRQRFMEVGGCQIAAYLKNPVLLQTEAAKVFSVGRTLSLVRESDVFRLQVRFAPALEVEVAALQRGIEFGNCTWYLGFLPLEWEVREDEEGGFIGYHIRRWELMEISIGPKVMPERQVGGVQEPTRLLARIEALEQQVKELEERIHTLEHAPIDDDAVTYRAAKEDV